MRAHVDVKDARPADKRWDWVRRGAPLICEIGPRDAANGQVTFIKRNALREGDKIKSHTLPRADFVAQASERCWKRRSKSCSPKPRRVDRAISAAVSTPSPTSNGIMEPTTKTASSKAGRASTGRARPALRWKR